MSSTFRLDGSSKSLSISAFGGGRLDAGGFEFLTRSGQAVTLTPAVVLPEPARPRLVQTIDLHPRWARALAAGFGRLWVATGAWDANHRTQHGVLLRFDANGRPAGPRILLGGLPPRVVAVAAGRVWVLDVPRLGQSGPAVLYRVDPAKGRVVGRTQLGPVSVTESQNIPADAIGEGFGSLWVVYGPAGYVYRVDPHTGRVVASIKVGFHPQAVAFAGGGVWIADRRDGALREIDPKTNRVVGRPVGIVGRPGDPDPSLGATLWLGTRAGRIWIYDGGRRAVDFLDPLTRKLALGPPGVVPADVAVADGSTLWLAQSRAVGRAELATGRPVGEPLSIDLEPVSATVFAGSLWTTDLSGNLVRITG